MQCRSGVALEQRVLLSASDHKVRQPASSDRSASSAEQSVRVSLSLVSIYCKLQPGAVEIKCDTRAAGVVTSLKSQGTTTSKLRLECKQCSTISESAFESS